VRVNRRLEHLLGAVRDLSGGLDWSTKIADHRDFLIRSEISLTANLNFPSRDQPATAIVARFWARGRGNHSLGCATPTVIVSQRVWIAIGID
jgi:hypothetical protein